MSGCGPTLVCGVWWMGILPALVIATAPYCRKAIGLGSSGLGETDGHPTA